MARYGAKMKVKFILLIVLLVLGACIGGKFSRTGTAELSKSDRNYPDKNPKPARVIPLAGSISPAFEVKLYSIYRTRDKGCRITINFIEGVSRQTRVSLPLEVTRDGDHISTSITLDLFKPGSCDWRFYRVVGVVSKGAQQGYYPMNVAWLQSELPETWVYNSNPDPATIRCKFSILSGAKENITRNPCAVGHDIRRISREKSSHVITSKTKRIAIRIIDMDEIN